MWREERNALEMVQMWSGWALGCGSLVMGIDVSLVEVRDECLMPKLVPSLDMSSMSLILST